VVATAEPPLTRAGYLAFIRELQRTWEYEEEGG
jgi:hypothetical protein